MRCVLNAYHIPVLVKEVPEKLITDTSGVYLDGTVGGGGHAAAILPHLASGSLYIAVDRDGDAIKRAKKTLASFSNIIFYQSVFSDVDTVLHEANIHGLNGVLLDLGVSSYQIDTAKRGFSFRDDAPLDMRMNSKQALTAADILNNYPVEKLNTIFRTYGEERYAAAIAAAIGKKRQVENIRTAFQLTKIIRACVPGKLINKSFARIFQALRIEVNEEMKILQDGLEHLFSYLNSGGRLVVISYHSLEDRLVKQFVQKKENPCVCPPQLPYCACGKQQEIKRIKPYPVKPAHEEIEENPRARSARMRVGEKL
ncbi:MAG: 16S rRNA (cytosine(1402)-N(4))-methyltransferase RsmH [Caldithrix sp.]|nr:16S rRNA (cytosine(1402)-N(4))-methyltransferase RsmH [Caldithrix sp.]